MFWKLIAWIVTRPAVSAYLIARAQRTPYTHLDGYMNRWWLFNPYGPDAAGKEVSKYPWWPWSIRIHHILREDLDRHLHDHPWNARTIILRGWYAERRIAIPTLEHPNWGGTLKTVFRNQGDTATINYGEYHTISVVPSGGVWTMFITGPYQGTWGFLVNGAKVQWREYLGQPKP